MQGVRVGAQTLVLKERVGQGWLARKQLERLLAQLGLVAPGTSLPEAFPEVRACSS